MHKNEQPADFLIDQEEIETTNRSNNINNLTVVNGRVKFNDNSQYFALAEVLLKMEDSKLDLWENNIGFTNSYRSKVQSLLTELDDPIENIDNWLQANRKYIKVFENNIIPSLNDATKSSIINEDGEYQIGDIYYKYVQNKLFAVINGDESLLQTINNSTSVDNDSSDGIIGINNDDFTEPRDADCCDCGDGLWDEYIRYSGSDPSRKVEVRMEGDAFEAVFSDATGLLAWEFIPIIYVRVNGFKYKGWLNKEWKSYNTELEFRGAKFNASNCFDNDMNLTEDWSRITSDDAKELIDFKNLIWPAFPVRMPTGENPSEFKELILPCFDKAFTEASSRGIGNSWAKINCNY